jgi:hypothetical protein
MSPPDSFTAHVAQLIPERDLPSITGVAAFELVATLETLRMNWALRRPFAPRRPARLQLPKHS